MMQNPKHGIYKHCKGKEYQVIGTALHTETHAELVVYQGLYDDPELGANPLFVRPKDMFLEDVEIDDTIVPRFKFLSV